MAAEVVKPDFSYVWASGGAIVAPSNVKIQTGWTAEVPPFQWENFLQNRQDDAILHLFQKGISEWDAASNYYFTTSGVRSYVQGSNGQVYVALQDSLNQNPVSAPTYWSVAFPTTGRLLRTTAYINVAGALQSSIDGAAFSAASATFTALTSTQSVEVEVQGGGAQGGGAPATGAGQVSCGTGGGGGGYTRARLSTGFNGVTVVVGAGGTTGGNGVSGQAGGSSSFGGSLSATGGSSGVANAARTADTQPTGGAAGGVGTGGYVTAAGGVGFSGIFSTSPVGGSGGTSLFGAGGPLVQGTFSGNASQSYGAGGGGAALQQSNGAVAGGAGKSGIIIVKEFA